MRELRLRFGKTQQQIAEEAGVDIRTYRKYETGEVGNCAEKSLKASQYEFLRNVAAVYDLDGGPEELIEGAGQHVANAAAGDPLTTNFFSPIRYVHRPSEEAQAARRLERAGTPLLVQAPERFGATRFVGYVVNRAREEGRVTTIRCNLSRMVPRAAAAGQPLLQALAEHLLQRRFPDGEGNEQRLRALRSLPTTERGRLSWTLEQHILSRDEQLLLTLERADVGLHPAQREELFRVLRSLLAASHRPPWQRLRLLLTVTTEPTLLAPNDPSSFWADAAPIRLGDFTADQVQQMAILEGTPSPPCVSALMHWLGGHPYLLRLALHAAQERDTDTAVLLADPTMRRCVFEHHLLHLRRELENSPGLLKRLTEIATHASTHLSIPDYSSLHSKGLVVEVAPGRVAMRCRLYREYFAQLDAGHSTTQPESSAPIAQ